MDLIKKLFILVIALFLLFSLTKNIFDYQKKYQFYQKFKDAYEVEKQKNNQLKTQLRKKSDVSEIERTIRDKLNLTRQGEEIIMINHPTPTPTVLTPTPAPYWRQWWDVYFR